MPAINQIHFVDFVAVRVKGFSEWLFIMGM